MNDARIVITEYLNSSLSNGGQGWTTQQHASAIIAALTEAGLIIVNKDEVERLRKRCAEFYHRALVAEGKIDQYVNVEDFYE